MIIEMLHLWLSFLYESIYFCIVVLPVLAFCLTSSKTLSAMSEKMF